MSERVLDVSRLTRHGDGPEAPVWWGLVGVIAIESTVFAALIASYFYLGRAHAEWPPAGTKDPSLLLPTVGTVLLLASTWFMHRADKSVTEERHDVVRKALAVGMLLGVAFLVLKVVEYAEVPYRWDSHAYGSIVWLIIGFHGTHVTILLAKTLIVFLLVRREFFAPERRVAVTVNGLYWQFVVVVWLPLYAVLYLSPRLLGGHGS